MFCFCKHFEARFYDRNPFTANKFKAFLELALNEPPYFDAFSVACDVFHFALRVNEGSRTSSKHGIESGEEMQSRKMRVAPVVESTQSFAVTSGSYPPSSSILHLRVMFHL